jgi:hypothetical protein
MLHDSHQVRAKPTRPKGGSYPTSIGGQHGEKEQRNQKEAEAKGGYTNDKIKDPKSYCHTTKEGQTNVETKKALKSTTTPPKTDKMVWRPKKQQRSMSTSLGSDTPSSRNRMGKGPTHWILKGESLPKVNW